MSQNNEWKKIVDDEYHSQPNPKVGKWVPIKWRRLSLKHSGSSSSLSTVRQEIEANEVVDLTADEDAPAVEAKNPEEIQHFIFRTEESYNWSKNALEFYKNGDAPFCYSKFLGTNKLDKKFWGSLLGIRHDNRLLPLHIEGWVKRMMLARVGQMSSKGPAGLQWSIVPPSFREEVLYGKAHKYGNGKDELYPPFWEIQYVYIPFYVKEVDEWLLGCIDLYTMEMTQYWANHNYSTNYSKLINHLVLDSFQLFFNDLLDEIGYWRHYKGPYISPNRRRLNIHVVNEEYLPRDRTSLGEDSGVLVCMLMTKLVQGKKVNMEGDFKDTCSIFRQAMAKYLYNARFSVD